VNRRFLSIGLTTAATAVALAGCGSSGSSDVSDAPATTQAAAVTSAATEFNDADVTFAQGMIPHHEQAIEMAEIALDPTVQASDEVRDIATRVKQAQDPEIELLSSWLTAWGQPMQMDTTAGHDMSSMEGMMSADEMTGLAATTGAEFDDLWMNMMIRHHQGAIAMATTVQSDGSNADAIALAGQIISAQQAEIDEMNALLGS
jgi:uncharacterized protein (DUF305 family)